MSICLSFSYLFTCVLLVYCRTAAQAAAFYVNCANYTAEVRAFFGREDIMAPYFLVLLNVFSPHRFLAAPDDSQPSRQSTRVSCSVSISTSSARMRPLSSRCRRVHASALGPEQFPIRPYDVQVAANADGEAERLMIYGEPSAPLAALSPADRARFIALIDDSRISSRVLAARQQANYSGAGNPYSSTNNVDWRWLFDFCVAALNDVRVDEVSQRDYEMRLAISSKFTPLIAELLNPLSSLTPSQTFSS